MFGFSVKPNCSLLRSVRGVFRVKSDDKRLVYSPKTEN